MFHDEDTSKSYVKESWQLSVSFLFSIGQKEGFFEGFFFIPSFLFILYEDKIFLDTCDPVTLHENYIYICQKCPPAHPCHSHDVMSINRDRYEDWTIDQNNEIIRRILGKFHL